MERSMELEKWRNEKISEFASCIASGIESWVRAGEIVAEILAADPSAVDDICQAVPGLPKDVIYRFESIGRKEVHPRLLLSASPGVRRLSSMPYSLQSKYIDEPIEVLIEKDGGTDRLLVKAENLTTDQCKQVFARTHIRGLSEQKAFVESEKQASAIAKIEPEQTPYYITGGKITFRKSCVMTKRELRQILKAM
jgi:hypothetical protein